MPRLLTDMELQEIFEIAGTTNDYATEIKIKQDAKTYPIAYEDGKEDTCKEVGEWLANLLISGNAVANELKIVEAIASFMQGNMPEEVK